MKLKLNSIGKAGANALLITVIFIVILCLSIGGYMTFVLQQARLGSRSQAWNMAIAVSEAGIEEGFQHLNGDTNNLANNGWSSAGNGVFTMTRSVNGTFAAQYTVQIIFTNASMPIITAGAYVTPPATAQNRPPVFFAAANVPTSTTTSSTVKVARGVQVVVYKPNFFVAAMVARGSIKLNGNNVTVDSFDSSNPTNSTNGQYDSKKAGDDGTVASDGGITNSSLTLGNANIYGALYTGAGEPYSLGPNGAVGTHAWQDAGNTGIESGYYYNDANFSFPDTSLPYNSGLTPSSNSVVTLSSESTNSAYYANQVIPPSTNANQTLGAVTTNILDTTTTTYPGNEPGLVTNSSYVTVNTYPGNEPALTTNCLTFTSSTSNPGSGESCETSFTYTTNVTSLPSPVPSGVTTNYAKNKKTVTGYSYPVTEYTYATSVSYTYLSLSYTYPTTNYSYTIYTVTPNYSTNSYDNVLSGGDYYATSLSGTTIVTGPSTLVMPNGYSIANLIIAPGGSLVVYCGGTGFTVNSAALLNQPGLAQDLIIMCAPSVTTVTLSGNAGFNGVIVAPNANVRLNGGGSNPINISGAIMADTVTINGHYNLHYDQELSRIPSPGRYILKSWQEIPPSQIPVASN